MLTFRDSHSPGLDGFHRAYPNAPRDVDRIARGRAAAGAGKRVAGHGHQAVSAGEKIPVPVLFNTHDIARSQRMTRPSLPDVPTRAQPTRPCRSTAWHSVAATLREPTRHIPIARR